MLGSCSGTLAPAPNPYTINLPDTGGGCFCEYDEAATYVGKTSVCQYFVGWHCTIWCIVRVIMRIVLI